jgi:hypothetical protein
VLITLDSCEFIVDKPVSHPYDILQIKKTTQNSLKLIIT